MSGQDEVTWSKEPPSEEGYYWLLSKNGKPMIAELYNLRNSPYWCFIQNDTKYSPRELIFDDVQFGPRIPSPASLIAAAKRVEELESIVDQQKQELEAHAEDWAMCGIQYRDKLLTKCLVLSDANRKLTSQLAALKAVAAELAHSATILQGHAWLSRFEAANYANKFHEQSPDHANQIAVYVNSFCDRLIEDCNKITTTNGEGER